MARSAAEKTLRGTLVAEKLAENNGEPVWLYVRSPKVAIAVDCPLTPHYTCGFFLFASTWSRDDLRGLIVAMLERGCVSMMFHGERCEEAHHLADDVFVNQGFEKNFGGREDTLMTTSMEGIDLIDAVFNLFCASPVSQGFVNSGYYVFSFGSADENAKLRLLLSDPRKTIRAAAERGALL